MPQLTPNTLDLDPGARRPTATIQEVAWISGHWTCDALGGLAEEIWASPRAGAMMGMFRLVRDARVGFYELLTIAEDRGSLILRIKHFGPDLRGWEEKDDVASFPLVRLDDGAARFAGLTMRRVESGMHAFVAQRSPDGGLSELVFPYEAAGGR